MNNKGVSMKKGTASAVILFATITAIGFILACAPPRVAKITAIVPARFHEASKLKEVAVLPFDGTGGKEFANQIEGTIASINIGDKQYFSIIDRTKLERVIDQELKLSQTGFTDPKTAAKVGKAIGAKGIYTGVITASNSNSSDYKESRTKCS